MNVKTEEPGRKMGFLKRAETWKGGASRNNPENRGKEDVIERRNNVMFTFIKDG